MKMSIVTTMYYSRKYLQEFYDRTRLVLDELKMTYEFIFVDDGSPDDSLLVALQIQNLDSNIKVVELSRNYGHQRAIMTGLQQASGDFARWSRGRIQDQEGPNATQSTGRRSKDASLSRCRSQTRAFGEEGGGVGVLTSG